MLSLDSNPGNVVAKRAAIEIRCGNRVYKHVDVFVPISDTQLQVSFQIDIPDKHLRESLSERASVRVAKYYEYKANPDGEAEAGWDLEIWDLVQVKVSGKPAADGLEVELLPETNVTNDDASILFAGEAERRRIRDSRVNSFYEMPRRRGLLGGNNDKAKFSAGARIEYQYSFQNAID